MKGATVPSSDHILRLISFQHVEEDGSIMGGGFISRPSENNMPSYNWMECFEGSISDQVASIRKRARIRYGGKAKLVRLNVGATCDLIAANGRAVTVIHDPLEEEGEYSEDPSHALMTNIPSTDDPERELIGDLICQCILQVFPARA